MEISIDIPTMLFMIIVVPSGAIVAVLLLVSRAKFKKRTGNIAAVIQEYQSIHPVPISVIANRMQLSEEQTVSLIRELISHGHIKRLRIDNSTKSIIYLDSEGTDQSTVSNFIYIQCPGCAGTTKAVKGSEYKCDYCGKTLTADGVGSPVMSEHVSLFKNKELTTTVEKNIMGCGVPILGIAASAFFSVMQPVMNGDLSFLEQVVAIILMVPAGVVSLVCIILICMTMRARHTRSLIERYMAIVGETRTPQGTLVSTIANMLGENESKTAANLRFLIRNKHLKGVELSGTPLRVQYLNDTEQYSRFATVVCKICGGESVQTYGKANKCPYCGNNLAS